MYHSPHRHQGPAAGIGLFGARGGVMGSWACCFRLHPVHSGFPRRAEAVSRGRQPVEWLRAARLPGGRARTSSSSSRTKPLPGRPWAWRGEFFGAFPNADIELVKRGWHLAYMSVPDLFGSPKAVAHWEKFYDVLVKDHGL